MHSLLTLFSSHLHSRILIFKSNLETLHLFNLFSSPLHSRIFFLKLNLETLHLEQYGSKR